jgi:hypothetical protein
MVVAAGFGERMRTAVDGCVADDQDGIGLTCSSSRQFDWWSRYIRICICFWMFAALVVTQGIVHSFDGMGRAELRPEALYDDIIGKRKDHGYSLSVKIWR